MRATTQAILFCLALSSSLGISSPIDEPAKGDPYFTPTAAKSTSTMPRVIIRNIREDRAGNIWFATFAGPIRYDGKEFRNFSEETGLSQTRVFSLLEDRSGALWFGSITGGASRFDGKSFTKFTAKEGLSNNDVLWIFEDRAANIWFATGNGVSRYDGKAMTNFTTKEGLVHNSVYTIAQDASGRIWFGTQGGVCSYDGKSFSNLADQIGRSFVNIRSMVVDRSGNIWFGGQEGAFRYDGKTLANFTSKEGLLDDFVGSMIVDRAGNLWFGHPGKFPDGQGGGASRYDGKSFQQFTQKDGLNSTNVYCMVEDKAGNIWFGSVDKGVCRYDGKTFTNFSATDAPSLPAHGKSPGTTKTAKVGKEITIELGNGVKMELVHLPKGTFKMGSPTGEKGRQDDEFQHEVEISKDFYLGKYAVTQEQYEAIIGKNPSGYSAAGGDKDEVKGVDTRSFPVEQVVWDDAKAFCDKLTQRDPQGRQFALPTEAEWEYACRGGKTTVFYWGDECNGTQANCDGKNPYGIQAKGPFLGRPTRVGSYERDHPHPWGLCDMHGNVWQWCADWYGKDYYKESRRVDPLGPSTGEGHVIRGGSHYDRPANCRCARRTSGVAHHRVSNCGFRVVLRIDTVAQDKSPDAQQVQKQRSTNAEGEAVSELSKSIWSVFQDKNNNYWFGSNGQGAFRYDGKTLTNFTTKDGLSDNQIRGIQEDKSGNIYINTVKGISKFDGQSFTTLTPSALRSPMTEWKLQPDDLWFAGAQDSGVVYRYDGKTLHALEFPKTKRGDEHYVAMPRSKFPNAKYSPYDVYTIYKDRRGSLWFGTATLGAVRFDGTSFDWLYEDHLTNPPGGGSFGIRSIIEDKEGKFWFCNTQYRYSISLNNPPGTEKGLIHYKREKGIGDLKSRVGEDFFYFPSIVDDEKGDLWMATYGGGVWRYDGKSMSNYPAKDVSRDAWMVSIYKDNRGDLWLGTNNAGAFKFNGKTFEKFKP